MKKYCRVKERNILRTVKEWKMNRMGHILCRNCLLKYGTEGKRKKDISDGKTREKT
jgi:hypothetical protein